MVATDDDGRTHFAGCDELVEREPRLRSLAVAEPADARRQALVRDARLGHLDPASEAGVIREQLEDGTVGPFDVGRVAGQRRPTERAAALAELRPDERRDEPGIVEGILDAGFLRLRAQVVAVVEDDRARSLEREHGPDVRSHRRARAALVFLGLRLSQDGRIVERDLGRKVAVQRVVRRGLVRHEVESLTGGGPRRLDLGGVADERDRRRFAPRRRGPRPGQALGRVVREAIDVADVEAALRRERGRPRSPGTRPRSSSPRAAARRPCRPDPAVSVTVPQGSRRSAGAPPRRRSRRCPAGSPGSRCRSKTQRSSARTSSGLAVRARGRRPTSPSARRDSSSRSARAAPTRGSAARRPACRSG